jgi:hypothetical protein
MMSGQNRFVPGGLRQFSLPWAPYGTVATRYLWRSLDAIGADLRSRRLRISRATQEQGICTTKVRPVTTARASSRNR